MLKKSITGGHELLLETFFWFVHICRHEAIMLQKLSIMLLSSAPKITNYAF